MPDDKPSQRICFPAPSQDEGRRRIIFRLNPEDIAYVVMILEAYDYIAIPRTIDQVNGIMEALCAPDYYEEVRSLVAALAEDSPGLAIIAG